MRIMDGKKRPGVLCESGLRSPSPSPNRRRRSADKRVVSVPIVDTEAPPRAKGAGETTPPADSWAWRKYGQKPIKGSPYPRGYYRCSSSKGCPARKRVERSRVDPTMLVVTYSGNHIHSPNTDTDTDTKTTHVAKGGGADLDPDPTIHGSPRHEFPDLIADEPDLMAVPNDFWFSGLGSASTTTTSSWAELALEDCAKSGGDDELFDGLGELPEYSVAFRQNYLERQMAAG